MLARCFWAALVEIIYISSILERRYVFIPSVWHGVCVSVEALGKQIELVRKNSPRYSLRSQDYETHGFNTDALGRPVRIHFDQCPSGPNHGDSWWRGKPNFGKTSSWTPQTPKAPETFQAPWASQAPRPSLASRAPKTAGRNRSRPGTSARLCAAADLLSALRHAKQ